MTLRRVHGRGQMLLVAGFLAPSLLLIAVFVVAPGIAAVVLSFTNWKLTGVEALHPQFVGSRQLPAAGQQHAVPGRHGPNRAVRVLVGDRRAVRVRDAGGAARSPARMCGSRASGAPPILLPLVVPESVAAFAWAAMLSSAPDGTVNRMVGLLGGEPVAWLQQFAFPAIIVVNIWRGIAFAMILFAAALEGVPQEVNEAATVDGASPWQILSRITLPLIKHAILLYMLLTTIGTVTVFGLIYFLTRGGPGGQTTVLSIFIYDRAFRFFEIGLGSAASVILLGGVLAIGLVYVRLLRAQI